VRMKQLEVTDFRNLEHLQVDLGPALTVFVGPNAAGKTNLIEAVRLLTATVALRRCRWEELVRWGGEGAIATLTADRGSRHLEIRMEITAEGRRTYKVNGQAKRSTAEVAGLLPSVAFTPDDLGMIKGSAEGRRHAVDDLGQQLSSTYGALRRDYARVVRQRNTLLRDQAPADALSVWDSQAAQLGGRLLVHRVRLAERVMAHASEAYATLSAGQGLGWRYEDKCGLPKGWAPGELATAEVAEAIRGEMQRRAQEERQRGVGLVGPHRDDLVFEIAGRDARAFASQGQQRSVALAWKLAEVAVVEEVLRRRPVLLLDDVMSELDESRRDALSELVSRRVQTIVTTTNLGYFAPEMLEGATVVELGE
jgi:DNA replication and repair protein RecF